MNTAKIYRVCIVGLSGIGSGNPLVDGEAGYGAVVPHSHVAAYSMLPETEIVGVCDLRQDRLDTFKGAWSAALPDLKSYTDYRQMLADLKPDIVSVVTSDNRHAGIVVDAANSGVRGIFCEKPIATTLADADRMIAAVEANGVPMTINHSRRWRPIFRPVMDELKKGAIGELRRIVCSFGGPRAMLFRNGTHMVDTLCMFADSDPAWVFAELEEGYENYWPYQGDGGRNPDLEPAVSGYIHFENGVRAFYNNSKRMFGRRDWELFGTEGCITVNDQHAEIETNAGVRKIDCPHRTLVDSPAAIRELIGVMENGGKTCSPPHQARKVLEVLLAFMASQKKGNIKIELPLDENAV
jgi:predicted dehydrogenase